MLKKRGYILLFQNPLINNNNNNNHVTVTKYIYQL